MWSKKRRVQESERHLERKRKKEREDLKEGEMNYSPTPRINNLANHSPGVLQIFFFPLTEKRG